MPLNWTPNLTTGPNFEAQVGEILWLEVASNDAREEWEWRAFDSKGDLIAGGTRGGRQDAAKSAAEQFAREWIAAQAAALGDGWMRAEDELPSPHCLVLVCRAGGDRSWATYYDDRLSAFVGNPGFDEDCDGPQPCWRPPTHWMRFPAPPPLPVAEVEE